MIAGLRRNHLLLDTGRQLLSLGQRQPQLRDAAQVAGPSITSTLRVRPSAPVSTSCNANPIHGLPAGNRPAGHAAPVRIPPISGRSLPEFGGLVGTSATALLNSPFPERMKKLEVTVEGSVKWSDAITLPYRPFIGTIGTSPEIEAISLLVPDRYGGNTDLPDMAPGAAPYTNPL